MSNAKGFSFKPADVLWFGELPARAPSKTATGRLRLFVETLKTRPGTWGKYPHIYVGKAGASASLWMNRHDYPEIEWEARGNTMWGRFSG